MKTIQIKIDTLTDTQIATYAAQYGVSKAELIQAVCTIMQMDEQLERAAIIAKKAREKKGVRKWCKRSQSKNNNV